MKDIRADHFFVRPLDIFFGGILVYAEQLVVICTHDALETRVEGYELRETVAKEFVVDGVK